MGVNIERHARLLMEWYCNLGKGHSSEPMVEPIARVEAIKAVGGKTQMEALQVLMDHFPQALKIYVGYPSHLEVLPGYDGTYIVSEMRFQSDKPGNTYQRLHSVTTPNALEAMINLKQRYDWEMSSSH